MAYQLICDRPLCYTSPMPKSLVLRRMRRIRGALAVAIFATAAIAACGGGAPTAAPASTPADALALAATEYEFAPGTLTAPAGAVTFAVTNDGTENHEFEVMTGETSLGKIDSFGRGATKVLTVTLQAGEYAYVCRLNGHDILGMKGTLTVTGG